MGHKLSFEPVVLHFERDVELAAGVVFGAMGASVGVRGCSGAHILKE